MYHHHAQEEKQAAIDPYISSGPSPATVKRQLGYPSRSRLGRWCRDCLDDGYVRGPDKWPGKFSDEQKRAAVDHYLATGKNGFKTVRELGCPSRTLLSQWIDELAAGMRKRDETHVQLPDEAKAEAISKAYSGARSIKDAISEAGVDKVTFCNWRKGFLGEEAQGVVDEICGDGDLAGEVESPKARTAELEAEARFRKTEVAIWKGAAELARKDPGIVRQR